MTNPPETALDHCPRCSHRFGTGCGCGCCGVPQAAIDAAMRSLHDTGCGCGEYHPPPSDSDLPRQRAALEAAAPHIAAAERERLLSPSPGPKCCDLHGRNCEAGEFCCDDCTEYDHPDHTQLRPCSVPDLSPNTPEEARKIAAAVGAERERACRIAARYLDGNVFREFADEIGVPL